MMKTKILIAVILLMIVAFCFCKNADNQRNSIDESTHKESTQIYSDSIRYILDKIKNGLAMSDSSISKLLYYFKENDKTIKNSFPANKADNKLFYEVIALLKGKARSDTNALRLLLKLSFLVRRNVEYSEYLMKLTPKLAIQNIRGFVEVYRYLDESEKKIVIGNLEFLEGPEEYKLFKSKINSIKDEPLVETANEIETRFAKYLMQ